jgi:hypothetical protein
VGCTEVKRLRNAALSHGMAFVYVNKSFDSESIVSQLSVNAHTHTRNHFVSLGSADATTTFSAAAHSLALVNFCG